MKKVRPIMGGKKVHTTAVMSRPGHTVHISEIDPSAKPSTGKAGSEKKADALRDRLLELQEILYAEHQRSLLVVLQALDTGGKDGAVQKIFSGLNPNGVALTNFKYPTPEEFDHDFLWRIHKAAPRKGMIGIWNRSHYEDVLVPLVHKQINHKTWRQRCDDINAFEELLSRNGTTILKFFLHISREEQKERLEARLKDRTKLWKFNPNDLKERALWGDYQRAYEAVITACTTDYAPWHIIPANRKWARNLVMLEIIVATLEGMKLEYPKAAFDPKSIVIE